MKSLIAVTGKDGQLGWELQQAAGMYPSFDILFCDKQVLDITNEEQVNRFFDEHNPAYFINCAAYTAVDKAEKEQELAYKINAGAVGNLASQCRKHKTVFFSYSTDYVFNGSANNPYKEDDATDPINYYGYTKRVGEQLALANNEDSIIIRTSWVYSVYGNNFVKTMLRLMKERESISVVNDQLGSPTYAKDLALATLDIIQQINTAPNMSRGIYHYSNEGVISWYEFATAIKAASGSACEIKAITSNEFPTPARRPGYSVLNKEKIRTDFKVALKPWTESLADCLQLLQSGR